MVNCRNIPELYFEGVSQRTISSSTGHSRNTVSDVVHRAKKLGVESLNDNMTSPWLEAFLFPEKQTSGACHRPKPREFCRRLIDDYGHKNLPPTPLFLPLFDKEFTRQRQPFANKKLLRYYYAMWRSFFDLNIRLCLEEFYYLFSLIVRRCLAQSKL